MDGSRLDEIPAAPARSDLPKVYTDPHEGEEMNAIVHQMGLQANAFAGPAWVTLIYFGIYYGFILHILRVRTGLHQAYQQRGEKFDRYFSPDRKMLAADRTQLNMLEQMPVFLTLLWLHAFLVDMTEATILGAIYTGSRALYPVILRGHMGRDVPKRILVITFTGYFVILAFSIRIIQQLL